MNVLGAVTHPGEMHKRNRLRSHRDFQRTTMSGDRVSRPEFVLYHSDAGRAQPRVGFAVGRRLGGAVVRNRIRRRLREAVRPLIAELAPRDIVIVARDAVAGTRVEDLGRAIMQAASGAGLLRPARSRHNGRTEPGV
jgi:ribonuclease P protein component